MVRRKTGKGKKGEENEGKVDGGNGVTMRKGRGRWRGGEGKKQKC